MKNKLFDMNDANFQKALDDLPKLSEYNGMDDPNSDNLFAKSFFQWYGQHKWTIVRALNKAIPGNNTPWISTTDKPIKLKYGPDDWDYSIKDRVPFMAAFRDGKGGWWIRQCCIVGDDLCVFGPDDEPVDSGWPISDVERYYLIEEPVK